MKGKRYGSEQGGKTVRNGKERWETGRYQKQGQQSPRKMGGIGSLQQVGQKSFRYGRKARRLRMGTSGNWRTGWMSIRKEMEGLVLASVTEISRHFWCL